MGNNRRCGLKQIDNRVDVVFDNASPVLQDFLIKENK